MRTSKRLNISSHQLINWLLLGFALLGIYLLTGSQQYDPDVLNELKAINHLDTSSPDPAHMLYVRIGVPFYRLWQALDYTGDALRPMQVLNAAFGAGTVCLFGLVLRHFAVPWPFSLLTMTAAGLSYAFWTHTVDAFFIIPACFFAMLSLLSALRLSLARSVPRRVMLAFGLGLGLSLAALSYQANLALTPALFLASCPNDRQRATSHLRHWLLVGAIVALVGGGTWLYQALQYAGVRSIDQGIQWFLLSHGGIENPLWRREGVSLLTTVPVAWLATVLPVYEGLRLRAMLEGSVTPNRVPSHIALVLLGATIVYGTALANRNRSGLWSVLNRNRAWVACVLWFAVPGAMVVMFDPAEVKLWLVPMFAVWTLLALVLATPMPTSWSKLRSLPFLVILALAVVIPLSNLLVPVWPDHTRPSEPMLVAQEAIAYVTPQDLLLSATFDWTSYVRYICDECRVLNAIPLAQFRGKDAVKARLWEAMEAAWRQGGHVYIVDYFAPEKTRIWSDWITRFTRLSPEDFAAFPRTVAWRARDQTVWELLPPP